MGQKIKRNWLLVLAIMLNIVFINAVQVVQKDPTQEGANEGLKSIVITVLSIGAMVLLLIAGIIIFAWILIKIWKKLSEHKRRKKSLIYDMFCYDISQCHYNYDTSMKKRNWKLLWLFWKRRPVYIENDKGQLEVIGQYHGECYKKEGFYLIGLYNKLSFFKYVGQVIVIPLDLKDNLVKKLDGDGKRTMFLSCEGIDRVEGSDYYFIPLIPDPEKKNSFVDFADKVHKEYIEIETYRDIITENLSSYREGIIKSVETNPFVHFGRRGGESFKK
ncbi:MAG: hypothetical protein ACOC5T_05040 [Elusimicrobiota bacterium]